MSSKTNRPALVRILILVCALAAVSIGCSLGAQLLGQGAAFATPTLTPRPTFTFVAGSVTETPTPLGGVMGQLPPGITAAPVVLSATMTSTVGIGEAAPTGATSLKLIATNTPGPQPTAVPTEPGTATPSPTPPPTLVPSPTPFVVVSGAVIYGRRGPGLDYELVGEARQGQSLMLLGRSEDQKWWWVCCLANQPVWVSAELVRGSGPADSAPVMTAGPTPTLVPTRTPAPTLTPSPTPEPPFDIGDGPLFPIQRDTGVLTIWVKVWQGPSDNQTPLAGYLLKVFRDDVDVSLPVQSKGPPNGFDHTNAGDTTNDLLYNLKFDMYKAGEARWRIYLARPNGDRVSPIYEFTTMGDSYRNQVMYIGYWLAR